MQRGFLNVDAGAQIHLSFYFHLGEEKAWRSLNPVFFLFFFWRGEGMVDMFGVCRDGKK